MALSTAAETSFYAQISSPKRESAPQLSRKISSCMAEVGHIAHLALAHFKDEIAVSRCFTEDFKARYSEMIVETWC
jgi:hypothetical protein